MKNVCTIRPAMIEERVCPLAHVIFLYPKNVSFEGIVC